MQRRVGGLSSSVEIGDESDRLSTVLWIKGAVQRLLGRLRPELFWTRLWMLLRLF